MRVLIDLQHPAHLHFFRNLAAKLTAAGHRVKMTGRDKDILVQLAREYNLDVEIFGVCQPGVLNLAVELVQRQWRLQKIIRRFKPDVMLAIAGTYISSLGRLFRVPVYVFYDTEHATVSNLLAYPFAKCIYVPRCYYKSIRWPHQRYNGYHELAYLHPKYFRPDPRVLDEVGARPGELLSIVRFVSWGAAHDVGIKRITEDDKIRAVRQLSRFSRVFVSAEGDLPGELEAHRLTLAVSRIHDLMGHAALIFGESGTMPSEGAVMGVPGVYVNSLRLGYLEEQARDYGIVFIFDPQQHEQAVQTGVRILEHYDRAHWKSIGERIVKEKIDVTELLYQIVMNGLARLA